MHSLIRSHFAYGTCQHLSRWVWCIEAFNAIPKHPLTTAETYSVNWITPRPQVGGVYTQALRICTGDTVRFAWNTPTPDNFDKATKNYCATKYYLQLGWFPKDFSGCYCLQQSNTIRFNKPGVQYYVRKYQNHWWVHETCFHSIYINVCTQLIVKTMSLVLQSYRSQNGSQRSSLCWKVKF
jgi:hypothetical protein